jgi:hypothetical protein
MIAFLKRTLDDFFGRGEAAITVPPMDGPLKPNQALEEAERVLTAQGLDNLVAASTGTFYSSGPMLYKLSGGEVKRFPSAITCLAAYGGTLAVGLESGGVILHGGPRDGKTIGEAKLSCPTAVVFFDSDTLIVTNGSAQHRAGDWRRDLMSLGRSGSLWRLDLNRNDATRLMDGLAWPSGVAVVPNGSLYVSECWRHRLLKVRTDGSAKPETILHELPAYPGRIFPASKGGYWLTFLSVRNQLVDFVLREHAYRKRMITEVSERFWMAPGLSSNESFEEPLQGSGLKQMGILKPWAATRSYGLVARCDAGLQPVLSYHSRADGMIHGVTSVAEERGDLLVGAKGPGALVRLRGVAAIPVSGA